MQNGNNVPYAAGALIEYKMCLKRFDSIDDLETLSTTGLDDQYIGR
jgi:hypothetical protein